MNTLAKTIGWFQQAVPLPTHRNFNTQLGVHVEEFTEMLESLVAIDSNSADMLNSLQVVATQFANLTKNGQLQFGVGPLPQQGLAFLDSLADQAVTGAGLAHMAGMDIVGALDEVNRSNWSKFEDGKPIFNENGKIMKGKDYSKPDLTPYI